MSNKLSPIHPGEVLLEEFIKPMGLSQNRLAIDMGVDARRINEIVLGKRAYHVSECNPLPQVQILSLQVQA